MSVQHYCGFTFSPLFCITVSRNCVSTKTGGRPLVGVGTESSEADPNMFPLWRQNGALQWGAWLFLPDHAFSGDVGGVE